MISTFFNRESLAYGQDFVESRDVLIIFTFIHLGQRHEISNYTIKYKSFKNTRTLKAHALRSPFSSTAIFCLVFDINLPLKGVYPF